MAQKRTVEDRHGDFRRALYPMFSTMVTTHGTIRWRTSTHRRCNSPGPMSGINRNSAASPRRNPPRCLTGIGVDNDITSRRLDQRRERLALHGLGLAGYEVYVPRVRAPRKATLALFPSYVFISIELQWHQARWAPGMLKLIMAGDQPARVPDAAIAELHGRERDGLVVLPSEPRFRPGDRVRVTSGPLVGFRGLVDGMKSHERVAVLLEARCRGIRPPGCHP